VRFADGGAGRLGLVGIELTRRLTAVTGPVVVKVDETGEPAVPVIESALVVYTTTPWPASAWTGGTVWICDDLVLRVAIKTFAAAPWTTATTLTAAVLASLGQAPEAAAKASEALRDLAVKTGEVAGG
jgi:phage-related minor tail protein